MRFAGIDIASETHVVAMVAADGAVELKATLFTEDDLGYQKVLTLLGPPGEVLIAMEATGHYWKNLFAVLAAAGHGVALLNALRTHRFAGIDLERTKTDAIDALGIARFAAHKRPAATPLPDALTEELRELVQLRQRLLQDFGDRVRQLHRLVDLGFPEFTRYVRTLDSELASAILRDYPTAAAFRGASVRRLAALRYDGRHAVGLALARTLIDAARRSVGQHHSATYRLQIRYACDDLDVLRRRLRDIDHDIEGKLREHEVGRLLTTIDGIGTQSAARVIAAVGDPAFFRSGSALAAYVGTIPALKQSGKRQPVRGAHTPIGNAQLRAALWMPTLSAVRCNPCLRAHYQRLIARGKLPKVALLPCMHKLLLAIYSVAKHRRPFVPNIAADQRVAT
jgi:transposase